MPYVRCLLLGKRNCPIPEKIGKSSHANLGCEDFCTSFVLGFGPEPSQSVQEGILFKMNQGCNIYPISFGQNLALCIYHCFVTLLPGTGPAMPVIHQYGLYPCTTYTWDLVTMFMIGFVLFYSLIKTTIFKIEKDNL